MTFTAFQSAKAQDEPQATEQTLEDDAVAPAQEAAPSQEAAPAQEAAPGQEAAPSQEAAPAQEAAPVSPTWVTCVATAPGGANAVMDALFDLAEEGEALFDEDIVTDYPRRLAIADVIREKYLARLHQEVPHELGVLVKEIREDGVAENAIDGQVEAPWTTSSRTLPHWIEFSSGSKVEVFGFRCTPRQSGAMGRVKDWRFYAR